MASRFMREKRCQNEKGQINEKIKNISQGFITETNHRMTGLRQEKLNAN